MTATKNPTLIVAGLCAAGLVTGFAAHRLSPAPPPVAAGKEVSPTRAGSMRRAATTTAPDIASFPERHSTETAESLALIPDDRLYASLALWLADATEPDIAAFWQTYSKKPGRWNDITDLIFLNWTRLDPKAAIAGSSSDQHAWWAWACHDPDAALAEARANAPSHINHVAWGIGEFHPDWLRTHYNELSDGAKDNALQGMAKWDDGQDPLASIRFCHEIGRPISPGTFKALIRQDPWAALDWVKANAADRKAFGYRIDDPMKMIIETMARDRPDDLERLAAQTPSGQAKLQMEAALFNSLLDTDPDAALEQARSSTVPRTAAERYAALGNSVVRSDPERAFGLAKDLFTACPDALSRMYMVEYPGGSSGSGGAIEGVREFVSALVANDPERVIELAAGLEPGPHGQSTFGEISAEWVQRDLHSYAEWLNRQTDKKLSDQGAVFIVDALVNQQNFAEAADWAMVGNKDSNNWRLHNLLSQWNRNDPQGAQSWLEDADLPADRKKELKSSITR
jgi:hypothetical protein